jgi:hypothetical protein
MKKLAIVFGAIFALSFIPTTKEKTLNLQLSEWEVFQLKIQLDNSRIFSDQSNLPHQNVIAIQNVCDSLIRKIQSEQDRQWGKDTTKKK